MQTITKSLIGSILATVLITGSIFAMPPDRLPGPERGPGREGDEPRFIESLNLTSEQIKMLKKEKLEKRKEMVQLKAEMETLQLDLVAESGESQPNIGKVDQIASRMGKIHGQMIAQRVKSIVYLRSLLTDEQKKIMDERGLHWGDMHRKGFKGQKHHSPGKGRR